MLSSLSRVPLNPMADVIQFNCPACGITLRLPLQMAAFEGPCPSCSRTIVAPDPHHDTAAYEPAPSPPPQPEVEPPQRPPSTPPQPFSSRQRGVLVLAILLTAVVSLLAGTILGARSNRLPARIPFLTMTSEKPESSRSSLHPKPPQPQEPAVEIMPESVVMPEKKTESTKASAVAESALKAFLEAPDWATRSSYVLAPDKVRTAMESYSHQAPDGPTPFKSIAIQNSYLDKHSGYTLFIFQVVTEQHPTGIPVAVTESSTGWVVDWLTFIEFRDDLFKSFADGPANQNGRFHLLVSAPPSPRTASTENEHFVSFLLDPPLPDRQRIAYVRKNSGILATLSAATSSGAVFTPVLEVAKRNTADGKSYLEIVSILAHDWLPDDG